MLSFKRKATEVLYKFEISKYQIMPFYINFIESANVKYIKELLPIMQIEAMMMH